MSENIKKIEMTKEERAKLWKDYYDWLDSIYPLENFVIHGKDDEQLNFYHGFNPTFDDKHLTYYLRDVEYKDAFEKEKKCDLLGKERTEDVLQKAFKSKAFLDINTKSKSFNFGVEWEHREKGYGETIYDNYLRILEMLGIENGEAYELRVYGNPKHNFLKRIETKKLVSKTNAEPNTENAQKILKEFSNHPNTMQFSELNAIIQYAINSNVSMEEIANAINDNGFNIFYSTINSIPRFEKSDLKQFKSFGLTGLKATCMHHHFMRGKNFGFMKVLDNVDEQDATLEFRRIFEEVKNDYEQRIIDGSYISPNLEQFGELEHIILDWDYSGLLFKNVNPNIQKIILKQAINKFGEFDPEHKYSWDNYRIDSNSSKTLRMLSDAELMDKDTYIALYQKALNRNYNLEEFDKIVRDYIDDEQREQAIRGICHNIYCPSPKGNWQKSYSWSQDHKIPKVAIPQNIKQKGKIRDILKQEITNQGIAKKTKIKTDMTGISKDGKTFDVDNLKDWLFGVPGAHGNLQMMGTSSITLPPQTPKFAVNLVEQALNSLAYPDLEER